MEIEEVTKYLNKFVLCRNNHDLIKYTLNGCILRKYNNKYYYYAELTDKNNNSVVIVPLEKVEKV